MADSLKTFQVHLTAVMDSLVRASVCEISKLFQDTVNDYLVEISLNRKENEALKLRLRLTENKLRNERKYGLSWASRRAGLASDDGGRKKRKVDMASKRKFLLHINVYLLLKLFNQFTNYSSLYSNDFFRNCRLTDCTGNCKTLEIVGGLIQSFFFIFSLSLSRSFS